MSIIQVVINYRSSYRIELIQLAISEFSFQFELIFWLVQLELSSAQLSSPNSKSEKAQLNSAHQIENWVQLGSAQLTTWKGPAQLISSWAKKFPARFTSNSASLSLMEMH